MPELPEVETVRRILKDSLQNKTITNIDIRYSPIVYNKDDEFKNNIIGKKIIDIHRYGKYLIFCLEEGFILSHLRMEGKYFYLKDGSMDNKHIHVIFHFDDKSTLYYQDVRKFGRMEYIKDDIYNQEPLSAMGYDLVLDDINLDEIYQKIKKRSIPIKQILLDQSIVSGLGNIYVDEVLFAANISPLKLGEKITKKNVIDIINESKRILSKAILYKGTTIRSYTSSLGVFGKYQDFLQVHTKIVCPNCKSNLNRVKIEGRMTYFCKNCQR